MRTWALINQQTNIVENIIKWDGETAWQPPDGFLCIECFGNADIGDTYENGSFIKTYVPYIEPTETQQSSNSELQIIG